MIENFDLVKKHPARKYFCACYGKEIKIKIFMATRPVLDTGSEWWIKLTWDATKSNLMSLLDTDGFFKDIEVIEDKQ